MSSANTAGGRRRSSMVDAGPAHASRRAERRSAELPDPFNAAECEEGKRESVDMAANPSPLTFHPVAHPSGALQIHTATTDTHVVELYRVDQAEGTRTLGAWFLQIRVAGAVLSTHSRHATMAAGRDFARTVLARAAGPTHADLLAAVDLVESMPLVEDQRSEPVSATAEPIVVIACGAAKLDRAAPAAELYTSSHFALMLRAARRIAEEKAGRVLILSALHGLVECDRELAPYDLKMGAMGAITPATIAAQLAGIAPSSITALLPRAYVTVLDEAAEIAAAPYPIDLFADAPGIGYQRRVASRLAAA